MNVLYTMWAWVVDNPWTTLAIVAYVVANIAPRPHPEKMSGRQRTFWWVVDRLCVLTAARLPGKLKMLLLATPLERAEDVKQTRSTEASSDEEAEPAEDEKGAPT